MDVRIVMREKIVTLTEFREIRKQLREKNQTVVLCHGVFDLVHYGHVEHLQEAKSFGNILVVSITAAKYVNKGPGRPYFSDEQRLAFISSLEMVDYVVLSEAVIVDKVVEYVQPDIYVKGQEYAISANDITNNIDREADIVAKYGGSIRFTNGVVFSSTKLLNNNLSVLPEGVLEFAKGIKEKWDIQRVRSYVEKFEDLKILLVGDVIIDDYLFCEVQGLMSKNRAISARHEWGEAYPGGTLAVARHLAEFTSNLTLLTVCGRKDGQLKGVLNKLNSNIKVDLIEEEGLQTVIKRRYLEKNGKRDEYEKLFSVNYLPTDEEWDKTDREHFYTELRRNIQENDIVFVTDYGQGMIDQESMEILQTDSKFLVLNCQTNSSNFGYNLITKYHRADAFTLDEKEIRLAFNAPTEKREVLLKRVKEYLKAKCGWLTIGADGALGIDGEDNITHVPALTLSTTDTIGAGDAFYSLAALCASTNMPVELGTLLGNIAGASKSHSIGNSKPVDKVTVLKFASTILNV